MSGDPAGPLRLNADPLSLRRLGPWLGGVLAPTGPETGELQAKMALAVHEVCMNVIDYAYGPQHGSTEPGTMLVECRVETDAVRIRVSDAGRRFAGVSSASLDGTHSPRYLALKRRLSGLRHQLTVPNSVVRRCQTIRQFTRRGATHRAAAPGRLVTCSLSRAILPPGHGGPRTKALTPGTTTRSRLSG